MCTQIFTVDAFTDTVFKGNPAAVCLLNADWPTEKMRKVAAEMNLSETSFVRPTNSKHTHETASEFTLRWFTPTVEVSLCGHATLAAAHVLFHEIDNPNPVLTFDTHSGPLRCRRIVNRHETSGCYEMDLPATSVYRVEPHNEMPDLTAEQLSVCRAVASAAAGGLNVEQILLAPMPNQNYLIVVLHPSTHLYQLELLSVSPALLREADPDGAVVKAVAVTLNTTKTRQIKSDGHDFVSRFFAPWLGVDEDPATGSLHCALAPYWASVLDKRRLRARQAYPGRGADIGLRLSEDDRVVRLTGSACTLVRGKLVA